MKNVKLIYGTDTGNTEYVIDTYIITELTNHNINYELVEVCDVSSSDWESHTFYILGIPTWYDGELQSDWEDYFEEFKKIDFTGKKVALFGLGDQIGYDEWFCDGVGILAKIASDNGGEIIGLTEKDDSYDFETSKALKDKNTFWGLCLDEDNQNELTKERLENWFKYLYL
jgi:flavodoxin I